jgi:hypothetical protein
LPEAAEGNMWITDFVHSTWSAACEADAPDDEDEEAVTYHRLERGLGWAHRAFNEIILPATMVSPLESRLNLVFPILASLVVVDFSPRTDACGVRG